jgi:hypothetical protein
MDWGGDGLSAMPGFSKPPAILDSQEHILGGSAVVDQHDQALHFVEKVFGNSNRGIVLRNNPV